MKRLLILCVLCVLCGCNPSASRVTKLETELAALRTELRTNVADLVERNASRKEDFTNLLGMFKAELVIVKDHDAAIDNLKLAVLAMTDVVTNVAMRQITRPAPASRYVAAPVSSGGIPANVMAGIRAKAEREWPGDYNMQVFVIKQETEAYQKLHP